MDYPAHNGLEVDILSLGNADSILVTGWRSGVPTRVLIDGGNASDALEVRALLWRHGVTHLDHLVCSHPHDDHAAGLVPLTADRTLSIGQAWVHMPAWHVDMDALNAVLSRFSTLREVEAIQKSLQTQADLVEALRLRGIPISEPFAGTWIGPLLVCGPSAAYYESLLAQFSDAESIQQRARQWTNEQVAELLFGPLLRKSGIDVSDSLLDKPQTAPENNSATILWTAWAGRQHLFTSDAGVDALIRAANAYDLNGCHWMQLPHHGSRRNINSELIQHFRPSVAYVSADGSEKHPQRAVVNAFRKVGTRVYSTHFPRPGHLRWALGWVPDRPGYSPALPLYELRPALPKPVLRLSSARVT